MYGLSFVAAVVVACSQAGVEAHAIAEIDTLDGGAVRVNNSGESSWTAETAWRVEEDLRLGSGEGQGPEAERFGRIMSVVSDSRGMIYVLDVTSQEVTVFDATGAFLHTIGGRGNGPGEFAGAFSMAIGPGDTLWVRDQRAGRYSAFAADGTFVRSHREGIQNTSIPGAVLNDGSHVAWRMARSKGLTQVVLRPIRFAPGFEQPDSLPPLEFIQELLPNSERPQPFFSGGIAGTVDRDGNIWFSHTKEYRIYRRTLEGDTTLVFSLPGEAARVGNTDRENIRQTFSRMPPEALAEYLRALPETRPIVHRILPDGTGHILVIADVAGVPGGSIVDVFRETGEYLGRMTLPVRVSLFPPPVVAYAAPGHLFLVVKDATDVPYISRLRIVEGRE